MQTTLIQRQYDEIIASHYDRDPQSVIGDSLDIAIAEIHSHQLIDPDTVPLRALDIGVGTGRFLEKLTLAAQRPISPFGLDLSQKMIDVARERNPRLISVVDNAANLDACFESQFFDLAATHFVTGFVPLRLLAPKIWRKLHSGGYWSFIGGTKAGFPALQKKANAEALKWLFPGKAINVDELVTNPADHQEVVDEISRNGFVVRATKTFTPELRFANFKEFLEFAYWGGWLTPFVERMGLHRAKPVLRMLLDTLVFPIEDHHSIEIVLAQKANARVAAPWRQRRTDD
jgi:ubiquinone/menaquinone biosynthesis C-methylase UbiE